MEDKNKINTIINKIDEKIKEIENVDDESKIDIINLFEKTKEVLEDVQCEKN